MSPEDSVPCRAVPCLAVLSMFAWCAEGLQNVQQDVQIYLQTRPKGAWRPRILPDKCISLKNQQEGNSV